MIVKGENMFLDVLSKEPTFIKACNCNYSKEHYPSNLTNL